jgi:hypothetical protein
MTISLCRVQRVALRAWKKSALKFSRLRRELELHAGHADFGTAEVAAQIEHGGVEARAVFAAGVEIPVGDDEVGDVPLALHAGAPLLLRFRRKG